MNTPRIETDRLILRRFTKDDIAALYEIHCDGEVNRFLPWFPLRSMEEAAAFFQERFAGNYAKAQGYHYAVCLKTDDIPIGYVNVEMDDSHDLGYGLRKEFWHRGIVTEAGKAVVAQLEKDGIPYITATHDVNNPRSGNVMKRLGMQYRYSYEEQWMPKNIPVTFRMYQRNLDGNEDRIYWEYWKRSAKHFVEML